MIGFEASCLSHELDGGQATASQEPVPHIEAQEHYRQSNVKDQEEAHQCMIFSLKAKIKGIKQSESLS